MSGARKLALAGIAALLLLNTLSGAAKVGGFMHRYRGEKAIGEGELGQAFESLNASLFYQPGDAPTYILIGRIIHLAASNGLPVRGLERYTPGQMLGVGVASSGRAIALNPGDAWAWLGLADVYRASRSARARMERLKAIGAATAAGLPPDARPKPEIPKPDPEDRLLVAAALKGMEIEPEFYWNHDFLANLYRSKGMVAEAREEIRKSFALMPNLEAHALLEDETIIPEMADPILDGIKEASQNPIFPPVAIARARAVILEKVDRVHEAVEAYQVLMRIGGRQHEAEAGLAIATLYQKEGKYADSLPLLDGLVDPDPNNLLGARALLTRGLAYARLEEHQRAVQDLRRYLARNPGTADVLLTLAAELAAQGDLVAAENFYIGVVRSYPDQAEAYRRLVALLQRQRRWKEALEYAQMLKRLDPADGSAEAILRESGNL